MTSVAPKVVRPNIRKLRENAKQAADSRFWKPALGINKFRILPGWDPTDQDGTFFAEAVQHYGFKEEGRVVTVPCLAAMRGELCPACILQNWLKNNGAGALANDLKPSLKVYFNIVTRPDNAIRIWGAGSKQRDTILSLMEMDEYADCLDPDNGRDWILVKEGDGKATKYPTLNAVPQTSPVGVEGWMGLLTNLQAEVDAQLITREQVIQRIYSTFAAQFPLDQILG